LLNGADVEDLNIEEPIAWVRDGGAIAQSMFKHVVGQRKADHTWVT